MLIITMKINSILKCSLTIILLIPILTQCISASSRDAIFNNTIPCDWQENNVFFYIHAYSDEKKITNQSVPVICFVNDVRLCISLRMSFLLASLYIPIFIKIKVWNNTGLIIDGKDDHFNLLVTNFTGLIVHRRDLFGYVWYLYGDCSVLKVSKGYN